MPASSTNRRVVVTGIGAVSAIGHTVADFWQSLVAGHSGVGLLAGIPQERIRTRIGAQIRGFSERARLAHWKRDKTILHSDRYSWLAAAAADEAIAQSGLETPFAAPYRVVCVVGSGIGGQITAETACRDRFVRGKRAVHPMMLPRIIPSSAAAHIAIEHGVKGAVLAALSAGASAAHAIGIGRDLVRWGMADVAIVGGSDSMLSEGAFLAAEALGLLSPTGCRPFAADRDGTALAEGAGLLVLEAEAHAAARGADVLAEIAGFAMVAGGEALLTPATAALAEAMRGALADAGLAGDAIDWLNAPASGSVRGDAAVAAAIRAAFGAAAASVCVSATRGAHGHAFGASPALEAIAAITAMRAGLMPATVGLDVPDATLGLDLVVGGGRARPIRHAMTLAEGLGGFAAAMVLRRP